MFDFDEIEHFYCDDYFESPPTRLAWFLYCYKFLTCVNGDWLRAINPAKARNQINLHRYITVSDEAFVRWVLEVKKTNFKKKNVKVGQLRLLVVRRSQMACTIVDNFRICMQRYTAK